VVIPLRNRPGPASQDDPGEINAKRGVFLHLLEELAEVALGSHLADNRLFDSVAGAALGAAVPAQRL
jgi:hypothetical protein